MQSGGAQTHSLTAKTHGMAVASDERMDADLRYERPCRWLLAVGAGINWVSAMLVITGAEGEAASRYAQSIQPLLETIIRVLG
jgi:hypothetical protein